MKKPRKVKNSSAKAKKLGEKRQKRKKETHAKLVKRKEAIRLDKIKKEEKFREHLESLIGQNK